MPVTISEREALGPLFRERPHLRDLHRSPLWTPIKRNRCQAGCRAAPGFAWQVWRLSLSQLRAASSGDELVPLMAAAQQSGGAAPRLSWLRHTAVSLGRGRRSKYGCRRRGWCFLLKWLLGSRSPSSSPPPPFLWHFLSLSRFSELFGEIQSGGRHQAGARRVTLRPGQVSQADPT